MYENLFGQFWSWQNLKHEKLARIWYEFGKNNKNKKSLSLFFLNLNSLSKLKINS